MAEFCRQCSLELFGVDSKDLAGLVTQEQFEQDYVANAICEGCAGGEFAPDGSCLGGCMIASHEEKSK